MNPERIPGEVELNLGFRGHAEKKKVKVPDGDAPPWDLDTQFATVGHDHERQDGLAKASGRARYAYDINLPGMLHGLVVRSTVARGKLAELDLAAAQKLPGVGAVIALKEVGHKVRFVGDAIAAIAATSLDLARDAAELIKVRYETEAHNVDWLRAEAAPQFDAQGNLAAEWPAGDKIDAALAAAEVVHSGTYRTEVQTHSSLETHGGVAQWHGNDLEIWASSQATFGFRGDLADAMKNRGYQVGSVVVHAEFVGGGFGSKFTAGVECLACCALAHEAKAPVKLMLDRFEEHTTTGHRPPAVMQFRAGAKRDGTLVAWDARGFSGAGYAGGSGVAYPAHYMETAEKRQSHKDIAADTDPGRAMRAPGWPPGYFAAELFLDELAARLELDPLAFRQHNDKQVIRSEQWQLGADKFGWSKARNQKPGTPKAGDDPRYLRGAGLASARWGGLGNEGRPSHGCICRIHADGTVETRNGAQDIGTGIKTLMAVLTAEELGLRPDQIQVVLGHTSDPSGPMSGGSTTAPSLAPVVRHAAWLAKNELKKLVAHHLGVDDSEITFAGGKVGAAKQAGKATLPFVEACKLIGPNPIEATGKRFPNYGTGFNAGVCGCQFAEVLVDTWTGLVRVTRMLAVQDCGLVIAKKQAESQVLGAMIQGIGYALHEQRIMDRLSGRMVNGDFLRYKVPGPADMPEMECIMFPVANGHTNVGAVGLGEPPSVAAPGAIANAVYNAIGVPVRSLPITPDKVLLALSQRKGN